MQTKECGMPLFWSLFHPFCFFFFKLLFYLYFLHLFDSCYTFWQHFCFLDNRKEIRNRASSTQIRKNISLTLATKYLNLNIMTWKSFNIYLFYLFKVLKNFKMIAWLFSEKKKSRNSRKIEILLLWILFISSRNH